MMSSSLCLAKDDIPKKKGKTLKKTLFVLVLALTFGLTSYAMKAEAQMRPGMMHGYGMGPGMMGGGGYGGWYCPYCGRPMGPGGGYGMGPGGGYGTGPGMMGPGHGMGPGYGPQQGPQYGALVPGAAEAPGEGGCEEDSGELPGLHEKPEFERGRDRGQGIRLRGGDTDQGQLAGGQTDGMDALHLLIPEASASGEPCTRRTQGKGGST